MALVNVLLLMFVVSIGLKLGVADVFDVTQYGAVGDGITDDTQAFLKAWKAACKARGKTILNVPVATFFLNPLKFEGLCQSSSITVQLDGTLVAPKTKKAWKNCDANTWITFKNIYGLILQGSGTLDARGSPWWDEKAQRPPQGVCAKPHTFRLANCNTSRVEGINFLNAGGMHFTIQGCNDLFINKITIKAPKNSLNTDGINMSDVKGVLIQNSNIGTGDDCIAINNNSFNINITGIACGPGHGISVGSLGDGGEVVAVEGIYMTYINFTKTMASARIKTFSAGSGYAKNIHYEHIIFNKVHSTIEINQEYTTTIKENGGGVKVSGIHYTDIQGSGDLILFECDENNPCQEINLSGVDITSESSKPVKITCNHAHVRSKDVSPPVITCTP